jgi:hypothetical protein
MEKVKRFAIAGKIITCWEARRLVDHAFASTWDEGLMLALRRSWWRIAADNRDQSSLAPGRGGRRCCRGHGSKLMTAAKR